MNAIPASDRSAHEPGPDDRLHRSRDRRILGGVAAGIADYFELDRNVVRIGFVVLSLVGGLAVPLYLAAWVLIPDQDSDWSIAEDWLDRMSAPADR
jgi:phage shock protein C